jgi:hypothetical protein
MFRFLSRFQLFFYLAIEAGTYFYFRPSSLEDFLFLWTMLSLGFMLERILRIMREGMPHQPGVSDAMSGLGQSEQVRRLNLAAAFSTVRDREGFVGGVTFPRVWFFLLNLVAFIVTALL